MLYSELIAEAIHELNLSKVAFAKQIGVSVITVNRILKNEVVLPSPEVLKKLKRLGIDISNLDYNDIYYEHVSNKLPEFTWEDDIFHNKLKLRHRKCGKCTEFYVDDLSKPRSIECPYCKETSEKTKICSKL